MDSILANMIISKNNSYLKLSYGSYVFHDARNFVPPNINLDAFGKMWGVKDIDKEMFPYEWFDNVEKLNFETLPPIESFDNKLKNEKCKPGDYDNAMQLWQENGFKSFKDYMMYYCERDVDVFLQGLIKFREILQQEAKLDENNLYGIALCKTLPYSD